MGTNTATDVYRVPGKLYHTPTDLSTNPGGLGTQLGIVSGITLIPTNKTDLWTAEEYGGEVVEGVWLGESWIVAALLRQWDDDALGTVFPNTLTGGSSSKKVLTSPGTLLPGTLLTDYAKVILFAADDATNRPSLILYRALPLVDVTAELSLAMADELTIPVFFHAVRGSAEVSGRMGRLADLTLSP